MTVQKSSPTLSLSAPQLVNYNYLVTNTGNVTLTSIALVDDNITSIMNCPASTLSPGANMTCSASHDFTQDELDANGSPTAGSGVLANNVQATSLQSAPAFANLQIPIAQGPAMTVQKSSTTTSLSAPASVPYSYVVTNTGNLTLTNIQLADDNIDAGTMNCPATTLAVGANMTCTASHSFTQAELDANGSPIAGTGVLHNDVTATSDQAPAAQASLDIPISYAALMTVKKSSLTTSLSAPQTVIYGYVVTNTGNITLTGIALVDDNINNDMLCGATTLGVGQSTVCSATHTFTQAELDQNGSPVAGSGVLHNNVTASSNESQPATDSLSIPITRGPAISVKKSSETVSLLAPQTVSYSYLVTNTGNITLTGVVLSDDNINGDMSCPQDNLAVGANMTCSATHTFTQAELDANGSPVAGSGYLFNNVAATSNEGASATDSLNIPIAQGPALALTKTDDLNPGRYDHAGQVITFTLTATNIGNQTLTNVNVSDAPALDNYSCTPAIPATLAPGASVVCTGTYTITQADLTNPMVSDTASATSDQASAPGAGDTLFLSTGNLTLAAIAVGGSAQSSDFTVTATGPSTLTGQGTATGTVITGSYTLTETGGPSNYTLTITCVDASNNPVTVTNGNQVQVNLGDSISCVFTNTFVPPPPPPPPPTAATPPPAPKPPTPVSTPAASVPPTIVVDPGCACDSTGSGGAAASNWAILAGLVMIFAIWRGRRRQNRTL
jgi:MYXO-CTERM domain-containing protein